ncbi:hypothetical protein SCHPADRAFT_864504 [Schizopora paradoxa]|uniref:Vacuolar assembly protein DID2 n=1 Tax=Schizopora paradoxa TaxID=27342 RepID=A0A0H2SRW8_9AGAM|nr:hypothetical protein SCHPADRAFT_864504 [Schizopora paradoxa]
MSRLESELFNLKFTVKQLNKLSTKELQKSKKAEEQVKKQLQLGNQEGARIYAANSIRNKTESLNMLRLASRIDAVRSRVETAVTMRKVTSNMQGVVANMVKAMAAMDTEKVSAIMDKFEEKFTDLDVQTAYMEDTISSTTAVSMPQDQVDDLMLRVADEANIELQQEMNKESANKVADLSPGEALREEDSTLAERLRALRPAT